MKFLPPPLLAILCGFMAWGLSSSVPTLIFDAPSQSAFTAGFAVLGLIIDVLAIIAFWQAKTTLSPFHPENARALVTGGIYQYSRNPMYLGLLCYLIAWTYHLAHPFAAFGPVAFVMLMNTGQIKREESALLAHFGDDYREYLGRVRRWI